MGVVLSKAQLHATTRMYHQRLQELLTSGVEAEEAKAQAAEWIQGYRREMLANKRRRLGK